MRAGPFQTERDPLQGTAEPLNHPGGTSRGAYLRKGEKILHFSVRSEAKSMRQDTVNTKE